MITYVGLTTTISVGKANSKSTSHFSYNIVISSYLNMQAFGPFTMCTNKACKTVLILRLLGTA